MLNTCIVYYTFARFSILHIYYVWYELSRFSRCSTLLHVKHNHARSHQHNDLFEWFIASLFTIFIAVDRDKTHLINRTVICQWWYRIQISISLSRRSNSAADISWSLCRSCSVQLRIFSCLFVDRYRALSAENRSCSAPLETFHSLPVRSIPSPFQRASRSHGFSRLYRWQMHIKRIL